MNEYDKGFVDGANMGANDTAEYILGSVLEIISKYYATPTRNTFSINARQWNDGLDEMTNEIKRRLFPKRKKGGEQE